MAAVDVDLVARPTIYGPSGRGHGHIRMVGDAADLVIGEISQAREALPQLGNGGSDGRRLASRGLGHWRPATEFGCEFAATARLLPRMRGSGAPVSI